MGTGSEYVHALQARVTNIAVFQMAIASLIFMASLLRLATNKLWRDQFEDMKNIFFYATFLLFLSTYFVIAAVLFVGAAENSITKCKVWISFNSFAVLVISFFYFFLIFELLSWPYNTAMFLLITAKCYFLYVIFLYLQELKKMRMERIRTAQMQRRNGSAALVMSL